MHTDRNAIFSLVARRRITAREAERLIAVERDAEDTILRLALCLAFGALFLSQVGNRVTAIGQAMATLVPAIERALHLISRMA
jgi:hypothetical protein